MRDYTVDIVIPVYKPDEKFHKLMQMLKCQSYPIHKIYLMNTEASYFPKGKYEAQAGVEIHHLSAMEFDHGGTRDRAASISDSDLILYMTQDAVPKDEHLVEYLVAAFEDETVGAAYARQLPNQDCNILERYTRTFNYGEQSKKKSKSDLPELGIKTFFCSNVCAAYRKKDYVELGGFEKHTIFNEDMIFAGRLIQAGRSIVYEARAMVNHSHNYGNLEQFRRNFDLAVSQAEHPEIFQMASSESEGIRMVRQTAAYLWSIHKPWIILSLLVKSGCKFLGYRMGKMYKRLPKWLILKSTMNRNYWR